MERTIGIFAAALAAAVSSAAPTRAIAADVSGSFSVAKAQTKRTSTSLRSAAPSPPVATRTNTPPVVVHSTGPEQAGYIHYFIVTGPDGEPESQVALELPGDRVAWSFPTLGVTTSHFIAHGSVTVDGSTYTVEHLYGIRPFPDDASMRVLQRELAVRVKPWLEAKTPHCDEEHRATGLCVSCLGFVLRVLYSGGGAILPALPPDFKSAHPGFYTTEDLLFYLSGVPVDAPTAVRLKRIEALSVPDTMREELVRISGVIDTVTPAMSAAQTAPARTDGAAPRARR